MNHENLIKKTSSDLDRLTDVLKNIENHHNFLQEQFDAYKEYLGNVRSKSVCSTPSKKDKKKADEKKKSSKKEKVKKPRGPFKYSHSQLEKDGVIMESEVPDDRFVLSFLFPYPLVFIFFLFIFPQLLISQFFI